MELKRNTAHEYDILVELGILQNVVEIDSMNYGWDVMKGTLRSRERYVGSENAPGMVYSGKDFYHSKFSVKRAGFEPGSQGLPWGLIFGAEEIVNPTAVGEALWTFENPYGSDSRFKPLIGNDGTIYQVMTRGYKDNTIFALDPETGEVKWEFQGSDIAFDEEPLKKLSCMEQGPNGVIYIGSSPNNTNKLYAIHTELSDGEAGTIKWSISGDDWFIYPIEVDSDGVVYTGTNEYVKAINPDGSIKWQHNSNGNQEMVRLGPNEDRLYYGTWAPSSGASGFLVALDVSDGSLIWSKNDFGSDSNVYRPDVDDDGVVYVGTENSGVYAVNPDGSEKWSADFSGYEYNTMVDQDGSIVYVTSSIDGIRALSTEDGSELWSYSTIEAPDEEEINIVQGEDGTLYLSLNYADFIIALDKEGDYLWSFYAQDNVSRVSIGKNGKLYFGAGSDDSRLYALKTSNVPEPLEFDLWMLLSKEAEESSGEYSETYDELVKASGESGTVKIETKGSEVTGPTSVTLTGKITDMNYIDEADVHFEYGRYEKETWWICGDPHVGYGNTFPDPYIEEAVRDVKELGISDFAVCLGDLVENRAAALPPYRDEMELLDHDHVSVLGNHDVDGWWWDDPDEAPLVKRPEYGSKIIGGVRFIWLSDEGDGDWSYDGGYGRKMYISDEQNDWFRSLMDGDPDMPTIIMCHQGPCTDGQWADDVPDFWDPNERGWLKNNIDSYNVIAWIHGHRHSWILQEDFEGHGFDRISVDSIDKNTPSTMGMFMEVERIADKTWLRFTFRDHANQEWTDTSNPYFPDDNIVTTEHTIEVNNGLSGWQGTTQTTKTTTGTFSEVVDTLTGGKEYAFKAIAEWVESGSPESNEGDVLKYETPLLDLIMGKIRYNITDGSWSLEETYEHAWTKALKWGLIWEKVGTEFRAYAAEHDEGVDSPESLVLSHDFEEKPWKEDVMGIWGKNAEIHTALGFARYEYAVNGDYEDYEVKWTEDGVMTGKIDMNRDQELIDQLEGGAHAFIYSNPHKKDVEGCDLYGERTELFNGYVTDMADKGDLLSLSLEGLQKDLDKEENVVLIKDVDQYADPNERVSTLDAFDVLRYSFDHASRLRNFEHTVKGWEWHQENDRILSVNGNLLNAVVRYCYFMDMIMRPEFVEEGALVDVNIDEPKSGETITVKTEDLAADREENIIMDLDLRKDIGPEEYVNKVKGEALLGEEDERWQSMRENRLDRLLGEELITEEEESLQFAQMVGSREEIANVIEEELEKQVYDWTGKLELHGHHHNLGGYNRQGTVVVEHSRKNISQEFRIAEMEVSPGSTELVITNKVRERTEPGGPQFMSQFDFVMDNNIIRSLSETAFEAYVDKIGVFDVTTVTQAKLLGQDGDDITDWAEAYAESYKGYMFIDAKFTEEHWVGTSGYLNPFEIVLKNEAGQMKAVELDDFYKNGVWTLDPDPWGTGEIEEYFSVFGNIGMAEDHYEFEIKDGFLVLGDISGGLGDPDAGGGKVGDPRGKEYIEPPGGG